MRDQSLYYQALAVSQLRKSLDVSDSSLMTVALLTLYEEIMRFEELLWYSHQHGVMNILLARPEHHKTSDLTRAIMYSLWGLSFGQACIAGQPSQFEEQSWLDLEPVWQSTRPPTEVVRLRRLAHQLMIRIPRLIANIRAVRMQSTEVGKAANELGEAATLASALFHSEGKDAEIAVLHRVRVVKTLDPFDAKLVSHSFSFPSTDEADAALLYWMCRLHILQLRFTLDSIPFLNTIYLSAEEDHAMEFDKAELETEQMRIATNIFMSWQYTYSCGELFTRSISTILFFL